MLNKMISLAYRYRDQHPAVGELVRKIFSHKLLLENGQYQRYVMRKAQTIEITAPRMSIETVLSCNAKCQMCGHSNMTMTGVMKMDLYKKIIDDCQKNDIQHVELSVYGEPSIDPHFVERVRYLRRYGMTYRFTTNGSKFTREMGRQLIELGGLQKIHFSANALDPEIYAKIMGGRLTKDETYKNILDFLALKEELEKDEIFVIITTVKMNVNKDDQAEFVRFWQSQKGVNQIIRQDLDEQTGTTDAANIGDLVNFNRRDSPKLPCRFLWERFFVYSNGTVGVCNLDWDLRRIIVGDMNYQSIYEINHGEVLNGMRELHASGRRSEHPVCGSCNFNSHWFYESDNRKSKDPFMKPN